MFGNSSNQPTTFNVRDIYMDALIRLQGFELFCGIEPFGRDLGYLARLVAEDRLDPQIAAELSWEAMPKALELLGAAAAWEARSFSRSTPRAAVARRPDAKDGAARSRRSRDISEHSGRRATSRTMRERGDIDPLGNTIAASTFATTIAPRSFPRGLVACLLVGRGRSCLRQGQVALAPMRSQPSIRSIGQAEPHQLDQCIDIVGSCLVASLRAAQFAPMHHDETLRGVVDNPDRLHRAVTCGRSVARYVVHVQRPEAVRTVIAATAPRERIHTLGAVRACEAAVLSFSGDRPALHGFELLHRGAPGSVLFSRGSRAGLGE